MKPSQTGRITLSEVATQAGTSAATVSYVLNETGSVSEETRERVLSAVRQLGYRGRRRGGRQGSSANSIGAVTLLWVNTSRGWQQSHMAHLMIQAISTALQEHSGHLRTLFYNEYSSEPLPDFSSDNALLVSGTPSPGFFQKLPTALPRLNLVCEPYETDTSFIDIDHLQAGYEITRHLIRQGHRHIGFVSNNRVHRSFQFRYLGYLKAMDEHQIPVSAQSVLRLTADSKTPVETAMPARAIEPGLVKILSQPKPPTAIIAANDWLAAAIYQYVQRNGLRIPEDISIAGFDDDHSICSLLNPALTTHSVPYPQIGTEAVRWLAAIVNGNPPHHHPAKLLLKGELVVRDSTAKLPA